MSAKFTSAQFSVFGKWVTVNTNRTGFNHDMAVDETVADLLTIGTDIQMVYAMERRYRLVNNVPVNEEIDLAL